MKLVYLQLKKLYVISGMASRSRISVLEPDPTYSLFIYQNENEHENENQSF